MKKSVLRKAFAAACLALVSFKALPADPLAHWTWRNPLPSGNGLNSVVYGGGTFVSVGSYGTITVSKDSVSWATVESGTFDNLNAVAYGNGLFIALKDSGVLTSTDASVWTFHHYTGTQRAPNSIAYGNNLFVAVGDSVLTSGDGINWTNTVQLFTNSDQAFPAGNAVAYGNGTFVTVGRNGNVLSSTNGADWIIRSSGKPDAFTTLGGVAYGDDGFVAVGYDSSFHNIALTSTNVADWAVHSLGTTATLSAITYGDGLYVAADANGALLTSTNGISWTARNSGLTNVTSETSVSLNGITYGSGTFVAVGGYGNEPHSAIVTSPDGTNWTIRSSGTTTDLYGMTFGAETFVAVGDMGTLLASTNGIDWIPRNSGTSERLYGVTIGNGTFVVVGAKGTILTSPDGINWASGSGGNTAEDLGGVAFGNGLFVAVGTGGTILSSPDAINWTVQDSGTTDPIVRIAYGGGLFVALSPWPFFDAFKILTSADATLWTPQQPQAGKIGGIPFPSGVAYASGEFVVTVSELSPFGEGTGGWLLHSTNAVNWTQGLVPGGSAGLNSVAYGNGTFVAAGYGCGLFGCAGATLLSSQDGITWTDHSLEGVPRNLRCVAYGDRTFVVGGNYGTILQSDKFGPRLAPFARSANGPFTFTLFGEPGQTYRIEASSDLSNWTALTNFVSTTGTNQFIDSTAPNFRQKFYRAVVQ